MGLVEIMQESEKYDLHPKAAKRIRDSLSAIRDGRFAEVAKDRKNLTSIALLLELSKKQTLGEKFSPELQAKRGREIRAALENITDEHLSTYKNPAFFRALNEAVAHKNFSIARHFRAFTNFLLNTAAFSGKTKNQVDKFPRGIANAFFALLERKDFDPETEEGLSNYRRGIRKIARDEHTDSWEMFMKSPAHFVRSATYFDKMAPVNALRSSRGLRKIPGIVKEQLHLLPPEELWGNVLRHKALIKFLENHKHLAGYQFVASRIPKVITKLRERQELDAADQRAIYSLGLKVVEGQEQRDTMRERGLGNDFREGNLDHNNLRRLLMKLEESLMR